jgi:hypothetical protein
MFERLLELHSIDVPDCACGEEMRYVKLNKRSEDAAVKHFQCDECGKELLLMVWPELTFPPVAAAA